MAQQTRTTIKTYFEDADVPTEAQFIDSIDSAMNLTDDDLDDITIGTTNKHFTSTDETKLDGIETAADVTDTANVTSAGALMDSELTSIADVKALDQSVISGSSPTFDAANITGLGFAGLDTDLSNTIMFADGAFLDSPAVTVASNGTVITLSVEKSGGGDIRIIYSTGIYIWDTDPTPDTVTLTAGSDNSPQINYIYVLESNKTLTVSTSSFPASGVEYAPIATVLCQSAATLQTDGAMKVHAWTDHMASSEGNGHLAHVNHWIRHQNATWSSGVATTPTVGAATFDVATSSGVVLQLHDHAYPAFDTSGGSEIYMVNYPSDNYKIAQNLTQTYVDVDANGTTLGSAGTDFYNLVLWGVVNEVSGDCKLMVNLPDGAYNNDSGGKATNDDDKTAVYTIPSEYTGVGFLIARLTVREASGTYTIENNEDLRGKIPGTVAGGGTTGGNEFADNVFRIQDEGDTTKEIAFQASGIATATTRTITVPDVDVTLATGTNTGDEVAASKTVAGVAELTTTAEIDTGTDTTRAMVTDQFVASKRNIRWLPFNLVEATTDCATATNIAGDFVSPIAGTILQSDSAPFYLYATNSTAGTTGTMVVDISIGGTSIMTTNKLDFDTGKKTTTTAATPPDLTTTALAVGDIITIDIDSIHTTAAKGLTVYMGVRE